MLENRFYIGDLYSTQTDQDWILRNRDSKSAVFSDHSWAIDVRETLSKTTYIYRFQNPEFVIKLDSKGSGWIGRHWILTNGVKSRIYTNCSALHHIVEIYRKNLGEFYENPDLKQEDVPEFPEYSTYLTLAIKAYNGRNALSSELKKDTDAFDGKRDSAENVTLSILKIFLESF